MRKEKHRPGVGFLIFICLNVKFVRWQEYGTEIVFWLPPLTQRARARRGVGWGGLAASPFDPASFPSSPPPPASAVGRNRVQAAAAAGPFFPLCSWGAGAGRLPRVAAPGGRGAQRREGSLAGRRGGRLVVARRRPGFRARQGGCDAPISGGGARTDSCWIRMDLAMGVGRRRVVAVVRARRLRRSELVGRRG